MQIMTYVKNKGEQDMPNHDGTGPNGGCCKQRESSEKHGCCGKEQNQHRHGQENGCCKNGGKHGATAESGEQKGGCCHGNKD